MSSSQRTCETWLRRHGFKVTGIFAAVTILAIAGALTVFAPTAPGAAQTQSVAAKRTPLLSPTVKSTTAARGVTRPITVVGIGDSVTSGYACHCTAFVGLYAAQLGTKNGLQTSSVNLGVPGWTSAQLLAAMTQPGAFRNQVAKADIVLVTIGANDLNPLKLKEPSGCLASCYSPLIDSVGHNVELIVDAARAAQPNHPPTVLVTNYWNVFQDGDVGLDKDGATFQNWSTALTRAEGTRICQGAQRAGAICVSLYAPFLGNDSSNPTSLLAADGDHPNAAGHQRIASALLAATPQPIA